ncbi:sterol desaturase family protein [Leptospira gomenensis]|uniref:Sterol desaturase family protein n=1 Tax=Leptospira gomenensis TaxID=2484974 RepID=A0A5F1YZH8_9LEPT|nr:sterol desaturase family protein [Leptospira gomenensis]TGK29515.1 sterol desaturase family protein [Leptospira gomenensis]TGK33913.1 sterol desaturase family protein [Leptospira gomenensis]TGK44823.1 sterol desaturase family protein [Leptospira gomenensis]TGK64442.1 sterol desaturase family protein [Leptospira gomenensis]
MEILKQGIRYFGFPILFFSSSAILIGYAGNIWIAYSVLSVSILTGMILERLIPFEKIWNKSDSDSKSDLFFLALQPIVAPITGTALAGIVHRLMSFSGGQTATNANGLSLWFQVLIGMFFSGFVPYWIHRFSHARDGFLWRVHSIHHSPGRLYWMNAFRAHPINTILTTGGALLPSLLLGLHADAVLIVGMLNNFVSIYNHMNIDFRLGFLNRIFNMNELHRWHHSKIPAEGNNNYSSGALAFWDILFGSYYLPKRKMDANLVGLFEPDKFPSKSILKQILYPVCKCS